MNDQDDQPMTVRGLTLDPVTNAPIVILKAEGGTRLLPIWIGLFEANAIALEMEKIATPRPMTHDLLKNLSSCSTPGWSAWSWTTCGRTPSSPRSTCARDGRERRLDARPSDAIALALRAGAPIFVTQRRSRPFARHRAGRRISARPTSGGSGSITSRRGTSPGTPRAGPPRNRRPRKDRPCRWMTTSKGSSSSMSDALKDAIRGSEKLQELLHEIENRGYTPSLTRRRRARRAPDRRARRGDPGDAHRPRGLRAARLDPAPLGFRPQVPARAAHPDAFLAGAAAAKKQFDPRAAQLYNLARETARTRQGRDRA